MDKKLLNYASKLSRIHAREKMTHYLNFNFENQKGANALIEKLEIERKAIIEKVKNEGYSNAELNAALKEFKFKEWEPEI